MKNFIILSCLFLIALACKKPDTASTDTGNYPEVNVAGAMRNVMWKGELGPTIQLDTIRDRKGLMGLGPLTYLQGEILIKDGQTFVSRVLSDSSMLVQSEATAAAPFFVYARVKDWKMVTLPDSIGDIPSLERFVDQQTQDYKRPFAFKLRGNIQKATIHIQNLPKGTKVSSPQEAHQGQTNYTLKNEKVDIIGFFSTEHQGIFTHHDSFVHLHLITQDETQMGHLDAVDFTAANMQLFLPVK